MTYYVYQVGPIDWWMGAMTMQEAAAQAERTDDWFGDGVLFDTTLASLANLFARAQNWARCIGWEGDVRCGPYFGALPGADVETDWWVGWKQDNNGTTFLVSPQAMPWIERECIEWGVVQERQDGGFILQTFSAYP